MTGPTSTKLEQVFNPNTNNQSPSFSFNQQEQNFNESFFSFSQQQSTINNQQSSISTIQSTNNHTGPTNQSNKSIALQQTNQSSTNKPNITNNETKSNNDDDTGKNNKNIEKMLSKQMQQNSIIIRQQDHLKKQYSELSSFFYFFFSSFYNNQQNFSFDYSQNSLFNNLINDQGTMQSFSQNQQYQNQNEQNKNQQNQNQNEQNQQQQFNNNVFAATSLPSQYFYSDPSQIPVNEFYQQQQQPQTVQRTEYNENAPELQQQILSSSFPTRSSPTANDGNVGQNNQRSSPLSSTTTRRFHGTSSSLQLSSLNNGSSDASREISSDAKEGQQQKETRGELSSHVRQRTSNHVEKDESRHVGFRSNDEGLLHSGEQPISAPSNSSHSFSGGIFNQEGDATRRHKISSNDLFNVENSEPLRRRGECEERFNFESHQQSNHSQVGQTQNQQTKPPPYSQLDRYSGGQLPETSSSHSPRPSEPSTSSSVQHHQHSSSSTQRYSEQSAYHDSTTTTTTATRGPTTRGDRQQQQQQQSREPRSDNSSSLLDHIQRSDQIPSSLSGNATTNSSLLQTRSSGPSNQHGGDGPSGGSSTNNNHGETQGRTSQFSNNNSTLCSGSSGVRSDDRYTESDEASLSEFLNSFSCTFVDPSLTNIPQQSSSFSSLSVNKNHHQCDPLYLKNIKNEFNKNKNIVSSDNAILQKYQKSLKENTSSYLSPSSSLFSISNKFSHSSATATLDETRSIPLYINQVEPMNTDKIKSMLKQQYRHRLDHLNNLLTRPDDKNIFGANALSPSEEVERSFSCTPSLAEQIISKNVAEKVDLKIHGKTKGSGRVFFVKEIKVSEDGVLKPRLRFIFWPKRMNEWLNRIGYDCEALLHHISKYLENITDERGATADAASGFYQYTIPQHARCWFRFMDSEGNLYQMCRLPMGLAVSVEIMQLMMEVLIGNPQYVLEKFSITNVKSNAFVDDIRISGSAAEVTKTCDIINNRAVELNITLKTPLSPLSRYTYLGAFFNHDDHSISMGEKLRQRIPTVIDSPTIIGKDFHSLIGRLIHVTAMLHLPLISFMLLIKWAARKFNQFNKDPKLAEAVLTLPPFAVDKLNSWCRVAHSTRFFFNNNNNNNNNKRLIIYVDASKTGWGATVITPELQIFHTGGKWSEQQQQLHINLLEATAFRNSVISFADLIINIRDVDFRIDNTSVECSVHRGAARKEEMIKIIQHPIEFLVAFDVKTTSSYVKSKDNLADPISRQSVSLPILTRDEVATLYERRGAGGKW